MEDISFEIFTTQTVCNLYVPADNVSIHLLNKNALEVHHKPIFSHIQAYWTLLNPSLSEHLLKWRITESLCLKWLPHKPQQNCL